MQAMMQKMIECEAFAEREVHPLCVQLGLVCTKPVRSCCFTIELVDGNKLSVSVPGDVNRYEDYSNFIVETMVRLSNGRLDDDTMCRFTLTEFSQYLASNLALFVRN
jgi:hypothetical protein